MDNHLAGKCHVTLILRLVINKDNQLVYGELVDFRGEAIGRFLEGTKLAGILETWIGNQGVNQSDDRSHILEMKEKN